MTRFGRTRRFAAAEQGAWIRQRWPRFSVTRTGKSLVAKGALRSSSITREYIVRVLFTEGRYPKVFVDDPPLRRRPEAPDDRIPHTYDASVPGKERPCLFDPDGGEWDGSMLIAETIIPWLMSWLFDYEVWLLTGEWFGGGRHPVPKPEDTADA